MRLTYSVWPSFCNRRTLNTGSYDSLGFLGEKNWLVMFDSNENLFLRWQRASQTDSKYRAQRRRQRTNRFCTSASVGRMKY